MAELPEITDAEMQTILEYAQNYSIVILRSGPNFGTPDTGPLMLEHGRRTLALRKAGDLAVVLPVVDDSDVRGVGVFDRDVETTTALMNDDPAVQAGVIAFEVHPAQGLPGDALPAQQS
ncbi:MULTISPECIES: hypothetical protein [unclassified Gordonia (in: high G+C Gram-positive bacteria)]